ncbi:MAG: helix-hairpin-helix domain-containing protein [Nitrospirales bacterium]|nr:helix-hairpin-helix domain-containing protein [Nitrospirales bacterium]
MGMDVLKSLAIKAGMLATTVLLVLWIGWPIQSEPVPPSAVRSVEGESQHTVMQPEAPRLAPQRTVTMLSAIPTAGQSQRTLGKLDLNRATAEQLQLLPGIGPVLAQRVVEQRTKQGPFHTVDDLRDVKGIGKKRMDQLRPLLMVDQVTKAETKRDARLKAKAL